jgi:pimeloyl-ACP methyl ester carboxylesterase
MTATRRGEVFVAGVRSPTLEAGPEGGDEAVVFVHGNPGSVHDWHDVAERVGATGRRALALDMPGFGEADKPATFAYDNRGYARHLAGALEALGVSRAHVVLHDFGGGWGLTWAAEHPEALASLTLVDTGVLLDYRWHALARVWRTPVAGELFLRATTWQGFRLVLRRGQPTPLPEPHLRRMYASMKDRGTQRAVLQLYRATPPEAFAELQEPLRSAAPPALVVWGRHDPYLKVEQAHRQAETFPGALVVVLEGSGHWPMLDDPDGFAAAVLPFLERQFAAR